MDASGIVGSCTVSVTEVATHHHSEDVIRDTLGVEHMLKAGTVLRQILFVDASKVPQVVSKARATIDMHFSNAIPIIVSSPFIDSMVDSLMAEAKAGNLSIRLPFIGIDTQVSSYGQMLRDEGFKGLTMARCASKIRSCWV